MRIFQADGDWSEATLAGRRRYRLPSPPGRRTASTSRSWATDVQMFDRDGKLLFDKALVVSRTSREPHDPVWSPDSAAARGRADGMAYLLGV